MYNALTIYRILKKCCIFQRPKIQKFLGIFPWVKSQKRIKYTLDCQSQQFSLFNECGKFEKNYNIVIITVCHVKYSIKRKPTIHGASKRLIFIETFNQLIGNENIINRAL